MLRGLTILSFSTVAMVFIVLAMCLLYTYLPSIHYYNLYSNYIEMEAAEINLLLKSFLLSLWMEADSLFKSHLNSGRIPDLIEVDTCKIINELHDWGRFRVKLPRNIKFLRLHGESLVSTVTLVSEPLSNTSFLKFCPLYEANFKIHVTGRFLCFSKNLSIVIPALYRALIPYCFWKAYLNVLRRVADSHYCNFTRLRNDVERLTVSFSSDWIRKNSLKKLDISFLFHFVPENVSSGLLLRVQFSFTLVDCSKFAKLNISSGSPIHFHGCLFGVICLPNETLGRSYPFNVSFQFSS